MSETSSSANSLFLNTSPGRLFLLAALPGAISMLASSLYGLLDGIFVGQSLGETAFASLNLAFPFVIINFSLADLIGVGSAVPISINLGMKKDREANNVFSCAVLMIILTGAAIGALLYAAAPFLIGFLGAEGLLKDYAVQYMRVYAVCSPVTTIVFAMDNYLRICGKIRMSMWLNIFMSVLTGVLEFTFLFLFRWGIWGAALATCSGMIVCASIALYPFLRGRLQLRFFRPKFSLALIQKIIACGSPNFLNNIAGRITSIIMNIVLLDMGGAGAVTIYGILMYVGDTVQPLLYGVCDSLQPAVGYNWGAKQYGRVQAIERYCFTAGAAISIAASAFMFLFPAQLVALFGDNSDPAFMESAVLAMRLFCSGYLIRWYSFASQSYMLAVERPVPAAMISVSTALIFPVILILLLRPAGLNAIWLNQPGTCLLAALLAAVLMRRFAGEMKRLNAGEKERG